MKNKEKRKGEKKETHNLILPQADTDDRKNKKLRRSLQLKITDGGEVAIIPPVVANTDNENSSLIQNIDWLTDTCKDMNVYNPGEVGYTIQKEFPPHGLYNGVVSEIRLGAIDGQDRRILYTDGESEDMDIETLVKLNPSEMNWVSIVNEILQSNKANFGKVGYLFKKHFAGHGDYCGIVREVGVGVDDGKNVIEKFEVEYTDGDDEVMDKEALQKLEPFDNRVDSLLQQMKKICHDHVLPSKKHKLTTTKCQGYAYFFEQQNLSSNITIYFMRR